MKRKCLHAGCKNFVQPSTGKRGREQYFCSARCRSAEYRRQDRMLIKRSGGYRGVMELVKKARAVIQLWKTDDQPGLTAALANLEGHPLVGALPANGALGADVLAPEGE